MKFVKRPGTAGPFLFAGVLLRRLRRVNFLPYAYSYLVPFRAVHLCGLSKPLLAEKILTPVIDRARF